MTGGLEKTGAEGTHTEEAWNRQPFRGDSRGIGRRLWNELHFVERTSADVLALGILRFALADARGGTQNDRGFWRKPGHWLTEGQALCPFYENRRP